MRVLLLVALITLAGCSGTGDVPAASEAGPSETETAATEGGGASAIDEPAATGPMSSEESAATGPQLYVVNGTARNNCHIIWELPNGRNTADTPCLQTMDSDDYEALSVDLPVDALTVLIEWRSTGDDPIDGIVYAGTEREVVTRADLDDYGYVVLGAADIADLTDLTIGVEPGYVADEPAHGIRYTLSGNADVAATAFTQALPADIEAYCRLC